MMGEQETKSIESRRIVVPGELLGQGRAGHGTFQENGDVYSRFVGLAETKGDLRFVIPLSGAYSPKRGDGVIGKITDVIFQKWIVDINSPYEAVIPLSEGVEGYVDLTKADLTSFFDYGDIIFGEIVSVSKQKHITLTMRVSKARKLRGGRLLKITSTKVPRVIGKGGSMVETIKNLTGTQIVVGQNGIVWFRGEHEDLAAEAIQTIEEKSHLRGLTDYIKTLLEERLKSRGLPVPLPPAPREKRAQDSEIAGYDSSQPSEPAPEAPIADENPEQRSKEIQEGEDVDKIDV